jgi:hypothetical protein
MLDFHQKRGQVAGDENGTMSDIKDRETHKHNHSSPPLAHPAPNPAPNKSAFY